MMYRILALATPMIDTSIAGEGPEAVMLPSAFRECD